MESIYLHGSEQVKDAGNSISRAADTINQAAMNLEGTLDRFLNRFEQLVERIESALETEGSNGGK
jgi:ABC-type transporter Mla subunit MlaD